MTNDEQYWVDYTYRQFLRRSNEIPTSKANKAGVDKYRFALFGYTTVKTEGAYPKPFNVNRWLRRRELESRMFRDFTGLDLTKPKYWAT